MRFYRRCPVPGFEVGEVRIIFNPQSNRGFKAAIALLEARHGKALFAPQWHTQGTPEEQAQRAEIYELFLEKAASFVDRDFPHVKILPVWHGTSDKILHDLFETGYANLSTTDVGFFGRGIYSAWEAEYAHKVYYRGALILNWVAIYSAYPVLASDNLMGGTNYANYDAHVVPVAPVTNDPNEYDYRAVHPGQPHKYVELVTFQSMNCLPRYLVKLQPTLPREIGSLTPDSPHTAPTYVGI